MEGGLALDDRMKGMVSNVPLREMMIQNDVIPEEKSGGGESLIRIDSNFDMGLQ